MVHRQTSAAKSVSTLLRLSGVINEAVGLARRFGATDGHKFVNAVMDKAARSLRPHEH